MPFRTLNREYRENEAAPNKRPDENSTVVISVYMTMMTNPVLNISNQIKVIEIVIVQTSCTLHHKINTNYPAVCPVKVYKQSSYISGCSLINQSIN